jgi:hypothetical protein
MADDAHQRARWPNRGLCGPPVKLMSRASAAVEHLAGSELETGFDLLLERGGSMNVEGLRFARLIQTALRFA